MEDFPNTLKYFYNKELESDTEDIIKPCKNVKRKNVVNSDDEEDIQQHTMNKKLKKNFENFFDQSQTNEKRTSSYTCTISKKGNTGVTCLSKPSGTNVSKLIKIELYDLNCIKNCNPQEQWKHADLRIKHYFNPKKEKIEEAINDVIYDITKTIAEDDDCKKYFFGNK